MIRHRPCSANANISKKLTLNPWYARVWNTIRTNDSFLGNFAHVLREWSVNLSWQRPLSYRNQSTDFYMIGKSVIKIISKITSKVNQFACMHSVFRPKQVVIPYNTSQFRLLFHIDSLKQTSRAAIQIAVVEILKF